MPITVLGGTKVADTTFSVANSCRFNAGDSPRLSKGVSAGTSNTKFTFSCWFKSALNSTYGRFMWGGAASGKETNITLYGVGHSNSGAIALYFDGDSSARSWLTNAFYRDPAAWYHMVVRVDTTDSTAGDRIQLWVNGVRVTSWSESANPGENETFDVFHSNNITLGREQDSNDSFSFDGYLAEVCVIDGTAYTASDFGEFDSDSPTIWKPKDVSGLTFGTNGFYLDFEDSGTLGNDANGGTDLTANNLTATDQCQDSPTNNICIMNPLDNLSQDATFSQGNTVIYTDGGAKYSFNTSTFYLSKGKWYFEVKVVAGNNTGNSYVIGISDEINFGSGSAQELGHEATQWAYYGLGHIRTGNANTETSDYNTYTDGDIIGVHLDLDNSKLYFSKNGTLENSTGVSITATSSLDNGGYFLASGYFDGDASSNAAYLYHNFGNGDFNATAVSSSVADDNGYGLFEYSPNITGDGSAKKFYAICTKNLAEFG